MLIVEAIAGAYLLYAIVAVAMVWAAIPDRPNRSLFTLIALILPFAFVWAPIRALFQESKGPFYSPDLARVEDLIEEERIRLFGGRTTRPSVSEHWNAIYIRAVNRAGLKAETVSRWMLRGFHTPIIGGTAKH